MKKARILVIYNNLSSFVKNDLEILEKYYNVNTIKWKLKKDILKIFVGMLKSDITYSWFASDHAAIAVFFSKIFRKKSIVIVGGRDVAFVPEINYGQFTLRWYKKFLTKYALKNADILLPVSNFTKNELLLRAKPKRVQLLYNCVDIDIFKPNKQKKENIVLTIGKVTDSYIKLKGLETFAKVSCNFPNYKFVIVGKYDESKVTNLKKINSSLFFTGEIAHKEVLNWLQRTKIYCQLSYRESFGVGVAEAMACECIPIVTKNGALPEVVGNTGYYVSYGNLEETVNAIKKALKLTSESGKKARKKIINDFSIKKREKQLIKILEEIK